MKVVLWFKECVEWWTDQEASSARLWRTAAYCPAPLHSFSGAWVMSLNPTKPPNPQPPRCALTLMSMHWWMRQ